VLQKAVYCISASTGRALEAGSCLAALMWSSATHVSAGS